MAAAAMDMTSSGDSRERQTKSPSPLSFWTKVSPDPVISLNRTVFTIVDDNAENSPRPPKPELSKLEARGMVSLSSQWSQEENKMTNGDVSYHKSQHNQQKPIKRVNFSPDCNFKPSEVKTSSQNINELDELDDDLVIVTDKNTQTDQPWPFLGNASSENMESNISNVSTEHSRPMSGGCASSNTDSSCDSSADSDKATSGGNNTRNNDTHNHTTTSGDSNASDAPTLKVEYVGKVWDAYINDFLLASDHISQAAIYDRASHSCIACSLQFAMSQEEFDHLLTSVNCLPVAYRQGIVINDRHYKTVLADGRRGLMAKGEEQDGCSVCQTRTLVLVALHDRRSKGRRCNDELMRLGDFFWAKGL